MWKFFTFDRLPVDCDLRVRVHDGVGRQRSLATGLGGRRGSSCCCGSCPRSCFCGCRIRKLGGEGRRGDDLKRPFLMKFKKPKNAKNLNFTFPVGTKVTFPPWLPLMMLGRFDDADATPGCTCTTLRPPEGPWPGLTAPGLSLARVIFCWGARVTRPRVVYGNISN